MEWEQPPAALPPQAPQQHAPGGQVRPGPVPDPPGGGWAGPLCYPLGAPIFSGPAAGEDAPPGQWGNAGDNDMLTPASRRRGAGGRSGRRVTTVAVPVIVLLAVAILALALLTGHGPESGAPTANQANQGNGQGAAPRLALGAVAFDTYPGREQRGVFQAINRVVASGNTIVAIGSQTSDGAVRQQFFVSADAGASWRLAHVNGQPPLGHPATLVAGGEGGWAAVGPQAIWTSRDGLTWTLAATHGVSPRLPGDSVWVITKTAHGFVAAGTGAVHRNAGAGGGNRDAGAGAGNHTTSQAVIWTSRDGLTWQRMTAAQLGLAGPGETVLDISHATWHGSDTVISGTVASSDGTTHDAAWLSTDDGATWTRVTIPAGYGAGTTITGLAFDNAGLIAVRPGRSASGAPDGVSYFSTNGLSWQYSGTIDAAGGWTPSVVKGGAAGFVVTGASVSGQLLAYSSSGAGSTWLPTGPLGDAAAESVTSAAVAPGGTVVAVGSTAASWAGQQPLLLEAGTGGIVRQVPLAGTTIPELAVNSTAIADGQQIAVGSANGYPAVWQRTLPGGSWTLVSSLALVQPPVGAAPGLQTLTSVTHGPAGWLAVGAPGPVILTSADGTTWRVASGDITGNLAGVAAVAAVSGPAGYVIVGKLVVPGHGCAADVWWSPDLTSWTRAHDVNDATGSSQVLAVAAGAHGFVSAGSHYGKPAVWTTRDGRSWETIVLPVPAGAATAVLEQIAINGNRVVALGRASTTAEPDTGTTAFAEFSADGGAHWQQEPLSSPGPDTTVTALTSTAAGFTAAGLSGQPGQQDVTVWTSATGTNWKPSQATSLSGSVAWQITALAPSGSEVTGLGSVLTQQGQQTVTVTLPRP